MGIDPSLVIPSQLQTFFFEIHLSSKHIFLGSLLHTSFLTQVFRLIFPINAGHKTILLCLTFWWSCFCRRNHLIWLVLSLWTTIESSIKFEVKQMIFRMCGKLLYTINRVYVRTHKCMFSIETIQQLVNNTYSVYCNVFALKINYNGI